MNEKSSLAETVIIRHLGLQNYADTLHKMHGFTDQRNADTIDEIWLLEHYPVFTQGQAGKDKHILSRTHIPIVQSDRGGQITYHGPGQLIMYVLVDIKRKKNISIPNSFDNSIDTAESLQLSKPSFNVRSLVSCLEHSIVSTLQHFDLNGYAKADAPGVYVAEQKICSLGLRIRKGCSFHGLALNVNMDLMPFSLINPCGYAGLEMCQIADKINQPTLTCEQVSPLLIKHFCQLMNYKNTLFF